MSLTLTEIARAAIAHGLDEREVGEAILNAPMYDREREGLRDEFAKASMQALIEQLPKQSHGIVSREMIASESYLMSDAMMAARAL